MNKGRFNVNPNVAVRIGFNVNYEMSDVEIMEKYKTLMQESEIIFEQENELRKAFIIKHENNHYLVSTISSDKKVFEEIMFFEIEEDYVDKNIELIKKRFEEEKEGI